MNSSFGLNEEGVTILKAGPIYRQRTFFRKWKKSYLVVYLGGMIKYFRNKQSERAQKTFNIKNDCIAIRTGKQCKHILPPANVETQFLLEIILTGERSLKFCAPNKDSFVLWLNSLHRCQSDKILPTPRHERRNLKPEEIAQIEEDSCWYCCIRHNKVETM